MKKFPLAVVPCLTLLVCLLGLLAPGCTSPVCAGATVCPEGCEPGCYSDPMTGATHWDCDPIDPEHVPPGGCPAGH